MMASTEAAIRRVLWGLLILVMVGVVGAGARSLLRARPPRGEEAAQGPSGPPVYGRVPVFSLLERSGRRVQASDLHGLVWIADFIYTRCTDTCPLQTARMAQLQTDFKDAADLRLVSITVDPARDIPAILARYADRYGADPVRWFFLTGDRAAILHLAREGFHLGIEGPEGGSASPLDKAFPPERSAAPGGSTRARVNLGGWTADSLFEVGVAWAHEPPPADHPATAAPPPTILHSSRFVLVDRQARIRGYYDGEDAGALRRLREDARTLLREPRP